MSPDFSVSGQYAYSVTVTNNFGCTASDEINIEVQDCASVEDLSLEDIIFYPNPFRDVVYSNENLKDYKIEVFDVLGRRIHFSRNDIYSLSIQNETEGFVFIRIKNIMFPLYKFNG